MRRGSTQTGAWPSTHLSPTKRKRECCSKNTAVSQAVWVAGCLLHPHLRLALLQGPRGLPEKREFSGSNVSTCSPPTAASGPAQPVSTMARVNFLRPGSEIQKQSLRSTERHSLNNQKNRAPNPQKWGRLWPVLWAEDREGYRRFLGKGRRACALQEPGVRGWTLGQEGECS